MNSPTAKQPKDSQTKPQTQRELIETALAATAMEIVQLRRVLWQVLKRSGPMELDETEVSPLWRMKSSRTPDGKLRLEAMELEPPSSHQISSLADALDGTMTPLDEAMEKVGLGDYPTAYVEMLLQSRVVLSPNGYWVDATLNKMINESPPTDAN